MPSNSMYCVISRLTDILHFSGPACSNPPASKWARRIGSVYDEPWPLEINEDTLKEPGFRVVMSIH